MRSPAVSRTALPPAVPGEFIPRRDHVVRLFWIAVPGMLPLWNFHGLDTPGDFIRYLAVAAFLGAVVGGAQGVACWRGTVPWARWLPLTALGWVTGAMGGAMLGAAFHMALRAVGIELDQDAVYQVLGVFAGAGAGWNAGSLQGMLLRRQGRAWKWWVYASTGAAALAALVPLLFFR